MSQPSSSLCICSWRLLPICCGHSLGSSLWRTIRKAGWSDHFYSYRFGKSTAQGSFIEIGTCWWFLTTIDWFSFIWKKMLLATSSVLFNVTDVIVLTTALLFTVPRAGRLVDTKGAVLSSFALVFPRLELGSAAQPETGFEQKDLTNFSIIAWTVFVPTLSYDCQSTVNWNDDRLDHR